MSFGVNIRIELYKRSVLLRVDTELSKVANDAIEKYLDGVEAERSEKGE